MNTREMLPTGEYAVPGTGYSRTVRLMKSPDEHRDEWEDAKQRLGDTHPDAVRAHRRYLRKLAHETRRWWADRNKPERWGRGG
jgi:hypothetical protein